MLEWHTMDYHALLNQQIRQYNKIMAINNSAWAETQTPANAAYVDITDGGTNYDDPTLAYDSSVEFYDGIEYSAFTEAQTPANANWTDTT